MNRDDLDFTGRLNYTSAYEHEVDSDPWFALDWDESPEDVAMPARIIASHWHGGQGSALYAFTSSGHLDIDGCLSELAEVAGESALALAEFLGQLRIK